VTDHADAARPKLAPRNNKPATNNSCRESSTGGATTVLQASSSLFFFMKNRRGLTPYWNLLKFKTAPVYKSPHET
jgi:hypothetical protein